VLSSQAVGENGAVVLGNGKPIFRGAGATPNMYSMLPHKQTIVPPPRILLRCLWCVHWWHVTSWKAPSVEAVGNFSSGPGRGVGEIA
jgi:hypothetical protein